MAVNVNLYTSIATLCVAAWSGVLAVFSDANVLAVTSVSSIASAVAVFFSDADVFAVAVVSTGRAGLGSVAVLSIFPSSALDCYTLVGLDFCGLRSLLVFVG